MAFMNFRFIVAVALIIAAPAAAQQQPPEQPEWKVVTLSVKDASIAAEIADTPDLRRLGLSFRSTLAADSGMLLSFPKARRFCLWMRDVSFPLSAIFIGEDGRVISRAIMRPRTVKSHCPPRPALYALETPLAWPRLNKIRAGDVVKGLPPAPDQ